MCASIKTLINISPCQINGTLLPMQHLFFFRFYIYKRAVRFDFQATPADLQQNTAVAKYHIYGIYLLSGGFSAALNLAFAEISTSLNLIAM